MSTVTQATTGISLEQQLESCRAFATARGLTIATHLGDDGTPMDHFEDAGVSGRDDDRPGLNALLALMTPETVIVVYSLSRIGRSTRHLHELLDRHKLASVTEPIDTTTPLGRMIVSFLASWAQCEAELTSEKTSAALRHLQSTGVHVGRPPYGFRMTDDSRLEEIPDEQSIIRIVREQASRHRSPAMIARHLESLQLPYRGRAWNQSIIRTLLSKESNV